MLIMQSDCPMDVNVSSYVQNGVAAYSKMQIFRI